MLASRRVISAASRRTPRRVARALAQPVHHYATEAAAPATSTPAAAPAEQTTPPTRAKPVVTPSKWPKIVKPAKPASSPLSIAPENNGSALSLSDVVYQPKASAYGGQSDATDESMVVPHINWATSFHGISVKPVTEAQFKMLVQPVEEKDIEVKPDGVIYLPEIKYRRRLNEVFGPMGWGLIPKGETAVGDAIVTREYALIVDGRFASQAQGENGYFSPDQLPSAVEGCKSNALMRCCKDLGIGSELWDPHFVRWFKKNHMEEVWVEHATTKKKRTFWYRKGQVEVQYPYRLSK